MNLREEASAEKRGGRVKIVSLTRRGVRVKTKVLAHLLEPPPELLTLGLERLEALRGALSALPVSERRNAHTHGRGEDRARASRTRGVGQA